jgi:ketosteroid isomerase-like protein
MATFETELSPSTTSSSSSNSVAEIQRLMDDWRNALTAKDLDRLIQHYDPAVRFFDAVPPYEHHGVTAYRRTWENMMPYLPETLGSEVRELEITAEGNIAFASCLQRLTNRKTNEAATCGWVRVTLCFQRKNDRWQVVHEHVSVPFNPQTAQAAFVKEL